MHRQNAQYYADRARQERAMGGGDRSMCATKHQMLADHAYSRRRSARDGAARAGIVGGDPAEGRPFSQP